ncbi:MAG: thiamine diphosphokinase [Eubacteriales bacterium]|nr:thiamine diphosphokinase [Eubacteriales bacterium]
MRKQQCYIVGSGEWPQNLKIKKGSFIIAADGGYDILMSKGIRPHILLGDMDSIKKIPNNIPLLRFPVRKDDTDISLAIKLCRRLRFNNVVLVGISGSRYDQFTATLQLMANASQKGINISAELPGQRLYALHNGTLKLNKLKKNKVLSVLAPYSLAKGVDIKNCSYGLTNAVLSNAFPLGVSNLGTGESPIISVREGTLLIFVEK